jgi:uncharacterized protein YoxC
MKVYELDETELTKFLDGVQEALYNAVQQHMQTVDQLRQTVQTFGVSVNNIKDQLSTIADVLSKLSAPEAQSASTGSGETVSP